MEVLSFIDIIRIVWQKKKLFSYILFFTAIVSAGVSLLIPEYYKSSTTIFPVKLSQAPVNETALRRGNITDFGETGEAEQALEILNSNRLIEKIIDKFDLYKHYELNKSEPFAHTYVVRMFKSNVSTKRNKFNSIEITVSDKDPQMASDIANSITAYFDTIKYEVVQKRANDLIQNLEKNQANQKVVLDSMKKVMDTFSIRGVMSQFQRGYLIQAYAESSPSERASLKKLVDDNIRYGEDFDRLERVYEKEIENQVLISKFLTQTKADAEIQFSQKFVVDPAIPAEKKYFPVRWLIVMISVISSFFIALSLLLLKNKWPQIRKQIEL
jgi:tyrosine-protein kinase Etk/Wzc